MWPVWSPLRLSPVVQNLRKCWYTSVMKPVKVTARKGKSFRALRLRPGFSAIVFELSNGTKIEVDLMESSSGNLLLRSYKGTVSVSPKSGSLEVNAE